MKFNPIPLITISLLIGYSSFAQDDLRTPLKLQSGTVYYPKNITAEGITSINQRAPRIEDKSFFVIQFNNIPNESQRKQLQQAGIELLDYIPDNAYSVTIRGTVNINVLQQAGARAIVELNPAQKMHASLASGELPAHAVKTAGTVDVWISFPKSFSLEAVSNELKKRNFDVRPTLYGQYRIIELRIASGRLAELAALPIVEYVQPVPPEDELLNNKSTVNARANVISSSLGRNLTGQGVVIGVGDNANPNLHIDFNDRVINNHLSNAGNHGLHVMGIAAGAGNRDERFTGYAPKATIIGQMNSGILHSLPAYVQDHGMVITNNSYGLIVGECLNFGVYDLYSRLLDQQAGQLPYLQNVFAAGNSGLFGRNNCTRYADGFGTVLGGYQSAKNVITVGNTTENDSIHYVSSKGPVRDGRIKPEISAQGRFVISSWGGNSYSFNTGTSMSAPAVAGGLALLWQHYRQLHGSINPKSGLMKAYLCNGATDLGKDGPDYTYGFGWMNLLRSAIMIENNNSYTSSIANGGTTNHVLNVPSNIAQLKVMLYWNDTAASMLARPTLVNDLDLEVVDPSSGIHLPFILDTLPANVNNQATTGVDHINNIEQVVIHNPAPGNYTLRVKGTAVTQIPSQEYFLVYDTIPVSTTLTYPIGREKLWPGDSIYISWDSWGGPANNFHLEYSKDNGSNWTTINNNIADSIRQWKWFVPNTDTTDVARIRITRNATSMVSTSNTFTIIGPDTINILPPQFQCEGYIRVNWSKVTGATDYEVMILRDGEMKPVATTIDTFYTYSGLSRDSVYWVTVRPRLNGNPGRRAFAMSRQPNNGGCNGTISDNDFAIDSILTPVSSGRLFTSKLLTASEPITVRIKNLDDVSLGGNIDVSYSINSGVPVVETISPTIAAGGTYDHIFAVQPDFSAANTYAILVTVTRTGDPVAENNTRSKVVKQLSNPAITSGDLPLLDDFESVPAQSVLVNQMGLNGRDRYDFSSTTDIGRLRTFINTGIARSGTKAITLDVERFSATNNIDSLTATYNMAAFNTAADDIRLDFYYKNHGQDFSPANKVWIRGNDTSPWIKVYDLDSNQNKNEGLYKFAAGIELSDSLAAHIQNFSTSFQVRWGQAGQFITADNTTAAGYTFDDIRIYRVSNDIRMVSIDTPSTSSCNPGAAEPVRVSVRNTTGTTINNVPVTLRVDGMIIATENIASIGANATVSYTFNPATANLSAAGNHTIEVWSDLAGDSYRLNDTTRINVYNAPVVTTFPYLENFETSTGGWHTAGDNNSWEYATPNSIKINRAASGSRAWKTKATGFYGDNELSYLYSPCFDISGMTNPALSLSLSLDIEECATLCDGAWVEYTLDGKTWTKLGAFGQGTNWYNRNYSGNHVWSKQDYTRWHVATTALPTTNNSRVQLRFVFDSDPELTREGIAVDDIHIYDNIYGIYDGVTMGAPVSQTISGGTSWIDFTSGGKLVASVQPNNQNMGNTDVQAYIHTGATRYFNGQYYHNRNITIKPATVALADSAIVRFYFLDTETEAMIAATGCPGCTKPSMAYELGVSKYSDPNDALEDGDILNDNPFNYWSFINATKAVKVPFDKGYYAEFKVRNFSEFWLNNGGFDNNRPLPLQLLSFTAAKTSNQKDVVVIWRTSGEFNVNRFEIELAKGNSDLGQNRFVKIGEIPSQGNSAGEQQYSFTDIELNKSGARYYRLKVIDNDGRVTYSAIRPVIFTNDVKWTVYPNPSTGLFTLVYQLNEAERMNVKVYEATGRLVYQTSAVANGFVQKLDIDMSARVFGSGLYLIEAEGSQGKQVFKVLKK